VPTNSAQPFGTVILRRVTCTVIRLWVSAARIGAAARPPLDVAIFLHFVSLTSAAAGAQPLPAPAQVRTTDQARRGFQEPLARLRLEAVQLSP
jgi:hypothetical protein